MKINNEMFFLFIMKELMDIKNIGGIGDIGFIMSDLSEIDRLSFMKQFMAIGMRLNVGTHGKDNNLSFTIRMTNFIRNHIKEELFEEKTLCRITERNCKNFIEKYGRSPYRVSNACELKDTPQEKLVEFIESTDPRNWDTKNYIMISTLILIDLYLDGVLPFDAIKRMSIFNTNEHYNFYVHIFDYIQIWEDTEDKDEAMSLILLKKLEM